MGEKFDKIDKKILELIKRNPKLPNAKIAAEVKMTAPGVWDRIRRLEQTGIIKGYATEVDSYKVGLTVLAFVFLDLDHANWSDTVVKSLLKIPYIQEIHEVFTEYSYILKVRAKTNEHLYSIVKDQIGNIEGIKETMTTLVARSEKDELDFEIP